MTPFRRAWVALTFSLSLTACEEPPPSGATRVPTTIAITPSSTVSLTALGATQQFRAFVKDQNGDTLANAPIAWSTSNAALVKVSASGLATAVANGSAQIIAKSENLTATVTVSVAQAAAQLIKVSGDQQTDTVGQVLPQPIVVQISDSAGHPMTGVVVGFAATARSGSTGATSATTNELGQAQTTWTLGQIAGDQTVSATVDTFPILSFAATATPDRPASVTKQAGDGQTAVSGEAVTVPPAVIVRDQFNNSVPGAAVTFTTTVRGGTVIGGSQTSDAMGIAMVGSWTLGSAGIDTLRATVAGSGISGNPAVFTATATTSTSTPGLTLIASGLTSALYVTAPRGDTDRIFVVQKSGLIRVVRRDTLLTPPFLNLSGAISTDDEGGLLSLAFHPNYASNREFYVDYSAADGAVTVARYRVSATNPDVAIPASGTVLLSIPHSDSYHYGGLVVFGPDGYLYIGTGDGGGGGGDPYGNGQDSTALLGKILRIDVDRASPYAIPPSNPFVGRAPAAPEIWAYGVRNPWRYSFDRATGDLYIADVGQYLYEEIDFAVAGDQGGHNYGWKTMEGFHCLDSPNCITTGLTLPVYEYDHSTGNCSVIGGYVYRGTRIPSLTGRYLFADYCAGRVWSLRMVGGVATDLAEYPQFPLLPNITSFGEDGRGELYITREDGEVYRFTPQ